MKWLNIEISSLRSAAFVGSEPTERATWLSVVAYCADQENGGIIPAAKNWKDRQWQQTCGVTLDEVTAATNLLTWEGDDLRVWNYPTRQEEVQRSKREGGRIGGIKSGEARAVPEGERRTPSRTPSTDMQRTPSTERKGIGKESNGNIHSVSAETGSAPNELKLEGEPPPPPPKAKPRNVLFDALAVATGIPLNQWTLTQARTIGVAIDEIRRATPDVTPEEIQRRANNYRLHFSGGVAITPSAMKAHWGTCANPPLGREPTATGPLRPPDLPRMSDEGLTKLARTNPIKLRDDCAKCPRTKAQATRLKLLD